MLGSSEQRLKIISQKIAESPNRKMDKNWSPSSRAAGGLFAWISSRQHGRRGKRDWLVRFAGPNRHDGHKLTRAEPYTNHPGFFPQVLEFGEFPVVVSDGYLPVYYNRKGLGPMVCGPLIPIIPKDKLQSAEIHSLAMSLWNSHAEELSPYLH